MGSRWSGGIVETRGILRFYASGRFSYHAETGAQVVFDEGVDSAAFFYVHEAPDFPQGTATAFNEEGVELMSVASHEATRFGDPENFVELNPADPIARIEFTGGIIDNFSFTTLAAPDCQLEEVAIPYPLDGSRLVIPLGAVSTDINVVASTFCDDLDGEETAVTAPPFIASFTNVTAGPHTVTVTARPLESGKGSDITASSTFTVAAGTTDDSDGNGIPDNPFLTLAENGDSWRAEVGEGNGKAVGAVAIAGALQKQQSTPVSLSIAQSAAPLSRATVTVPRGIVEDGELGVLIAQIAPDLPSLLGDSSVVREMADSLPEPIAMGGRLVEISLLLSTDGGDSFFEAAPLRIADNPPTLVLEGLTGSANTRLDVFSHPTLIDDPESGIDVVGQEGDWTSGAAAGEELQGNALTSTLTSLSVFAPLEIE